MKNKIKNRKKKKIKKELFDEKWSRPVKKPNPIEKIKMLGVAIERLILVTMKNHIYSFKSVKRLQKSGCGTGLDATGELGDLFMLWWDGIFTKILKDCQLNMDIFVRFKDDINILMNKLLVENNQIRELLGDIYVAPGNYEGNMEDYTADIVCKIANTVSDMISFTYDTPGMNKDNKLPVLDVKVCVNSENKILHDFYEKPTRNPKVILASSALSWAQKRSIHTQEILRRLKNTSEDLGQEVQNSHIANYLLRMKLCGYSQKFRKEVFLSAKNAYKEIYQKSKSENTPIFRNRKELDERKKLKKNAP